MASTFSGRFNPSSGILAYHRFCNKPLLVHERGNVKGSYSICLSGEPSNPFLSYNAWNLDMKSGLNPKSGISFIQHISNKMLGKKQNGYNFSREDSQKFDWSSLGKYICYMTSSSDEISSFVRSCTYDQQLIDLKNLLLWSAKHSFRVVVRHHPNLGTIGRPNEASLFLDAVHSLNSPNLLIIDPHQDVNTYRLAYGASFTLSPQSTLSIDLPLLGFNTIVPDYSPYAPFYHHVLNIDSISSFTPAQLEVFAYENIRYCSALEYLAYKHYISTSWSFQGVSINGFKPGKFDLSASLCDSCAEQLISQIDLALEKSKPGFLCWHDTIDYDV